MVSEIPRPGIANQAVPQGNDLEWKAHGNDCGVIIRMVMGDRNLLARAEGQSQAAWLTFGVVRKRNTANDEARSCKDSGIAICGAAFVESGVEFNLWPEEPSDSTFCDSILGDVIPGDGVSQAFRIGYWQRSAKCSAT